MHFHSISSQELNMVNYHFELWDKRKKINAYYFSTSHFKIAPKMHSVKREYSIALFGLSKDEQTKENIRLIWNISTGVITYFHYYIINMPWQSY